MTTAVYTAREGDTIDWLCWRYYGATSGAVEKVLEANPGLSRADPNLPAGTRIILPVLAKPLATNAVVRLWG
jgi:phage tail protein X